MVKLSEIDKFLCYSVQCDGYDISQELNFKMKSGIIKIMRNNFSRFWNLLSKEQRMKYIKLSVEKEELYNTMEKIIRYSCEVSRKDFNLYFMNFDLLREEFDVYSAESLNYDYDDVDEYNDIKHNILKFWISLTIEKKKKLISIINKYWETNKHNEFIKIEYIKNHNEFVKTPINKYDGGEYFRCEDQGLKNIDLLCHENMKVKNCNNNKITELDNLPIGLEELYCEYNEIKSLNNLPKCLKILCCRYNDINELLHLLLSLIHLDCSENKINQIEIPSYLEVFYCEDTEINIELFPNMLNVIYLKYTKGNIKWKLPYGLKEIVFDENWGCEKYINVPRSVKKMNDKEIDNVFLLCS